MRRLLFVRFLLYVVLLYCCIVLLSLCYYLLCLLFTYCCCDSVVVGAVLVDKAVSFTLLSFWTVLFLLVCCCLRICVHGLYVACKLCHSWLCNCGYNACSLSSRYCSSIVICMSSSSWFTFGKFHLEIRSANLDFDCENLSNC